MSKLRLYFNKHGDLPWSVDEGTLATERQFAKVLISTCVAATTVYAPIDGVNTLDMPIAWVEWEHVRLSTLDGVGVIY